MRSKLQRIPVAYVFLVLLFLFLPLVPNSFLRIVMVHVVTFSIFALSYNLLLGYTGLFSLGHAAFWGVGGYTVGILITQGVTDNFILVMLAVILVGGAVSCVFGFLALRTKGIFFVLITLALSEMLRALARTFRSITGGEDGLTGFGAPYGLEGLSLYYFIFFFFLLCSFILYWLASSRYGYVLKGIRDNEGRMAALGYNTWASKYVCFVVSGVFAAIAGALFTYWNLIIGPESLSLWVTGKAVLMALLGGIGYFAGPMIGSVVIVLLSQVVSSYTMHWTAIAGVAIILVVMFARQGLAGLIHNVWKSWSKRYILPFGS